MTLDKQTVFTRVKEHLLKQGVRSIIPGGSCRYRGPNNTSCAVGCLIPDEKYTSEMEGMPSTNVLVFEALGLDGKTNWELITFLRALQCVHDTHEPPDWPVQLKALADKHNLIY